MVQIISQNRWLPGKNPAVTKSVQRELRNLLKKVYLIEKENATESFVDIWHLIFRGCWCNQEAESPPSCLHNLSSLSWRMFPSYKKRSRQNKAPAP